jgi:hypothetical protein
MVHVHLRSAGVIAAVLGLSCATRAGVLSSPIVNPSNGHTYQLLTSSTWATAETTAAALGGHLATIRNADEQQWVFSTFGNFNGVQRLLWIGLNDIAVEGQFRWTSGEPVTYTNFEGGEPNDAGGNEDFVAMYYPGYHSPGVWNDWNDRTGDPIGVPFAGVAEFVPEPGTALLLIPALAWMGVRPRRAGVRR